MATTEQTTEWWQDQGEVLAFAQVLADNDVFVGDSKAALREAFYFMSKPWKWAVEHARWVQAGRPETFDFSEAAAAE